MKTRKRFSIFGVIGVLILLLAFGLTGCGGKEEEKAETPKEPAVEKAEAPKEAAAPVEKTLVFGRGGDSVGLDPAYETDGNSFMVCDNVFEALVFYADESTALEPGYCFSEERHACRTGTFPFDRTTPHAGGMLNSGIFCYSFQPL